MLGVVGKEDGPKPAVVIFRDAAENPVTWSLITRSDRLDDYVDAGEPRWRHREAEDPNRFHKP
jgi:hypothetical protein